jgi:hypothetical protein
MPEDWVLPLLACVALGAAVGVYLGFGLRGPSVAFENEREELLTLTLARRLRCPLESALAAVRRELRIEPGQSDETILKRAAYHYTRNLPEPGGCSVYRDRAAG